MQKFLQDKVELFQGSIPIDILYIFQKLKSNGYEVFLVGGAVRDIILAGEYSKANLADSDFDFTTNAKPDEIISIFKERGKSKVFTIPTGLNHGTVTVVIEKNDNFSRYEVTTYRIDGTYEDGRHPSNIKFSNSLEEDLSRRDFTINALAYDAIEKRLYDPFNGIKDMKKGLIKTVGDPLERFREDGLRPLRACRFAAQLEFKIENNTVEAIPLTLDIAAKVSLERVNDEIIKLIKTKKPSTGLEYMRQSGLLNLFIPELLEGYNIDQNEFHKHDVYYHNLYTCDAVTSDKPLIRLAGLLHDIGKPRAKNFALTNGNGNVFYNHEIIGERITQRVLKRLKFSNSDLNYVIKLVKMHMFYYTKEWSDGAVRRFLRKIDGNKSFLEDLFELRRADRIGSGLKLGDADILQKFRQRINAIIDADNALKVTDLDVNGHDIMERFNLKPSRIIGDMLEFMLQKVLDNPGLNKKEELFLIGTEFLVLQNNKENNIKECRDEKEEISILI